MSRTVEKGHGAVRIHGRFVGSGLFGCLASMRTCVASQ